jgi:hypothetical protein
VRRADNLTAICEQIVYYLLSAKSLQAEKYDHILLKRSSLILVTLMMRALSSSQTSVLTRATRRNNPEDTILHSHRRENLKSYRKISVALDGKRSPAIRLISVSTELS